jgi:dTMP kinase
MTYGTAPLAAVLLAILGWIATGLGHVSPVFHTNKVDLALYFNGASYFVSAMTVYTLRQIGKREHSASISAPSIAKAIVEGWRFIRHTPVVRGLVIGMLGAFCAAGVVIGLAPSYILYTLHGGSAGFSLVFAVILIGLAIGMGFGSRPFGDFSRRRLFGVTLTASAVPLAMIALVPNLAVVTIFAFLMGVISGTAYPIGFTIVGWEVDDDTRGRVFAFFQSTIQAILFAVIAVVGFIATGFSAAIGALNGSRNGVVTIAHITYGAPGDNLLLLLSAVLVAFVGVKSYRQLDDRKGVPLFEDLITAVRNEPLSKAPSAPLPDGGAVPSRPVGLFVAFEGGEGVGKTTQARLIAIWLREQGYDVVTTNEPGATKLGMRLRALLLDTAHAGMSPHSEALLYAADRAEHVARVIDPALERGAVVITDRFIDSSLAYQGAGRGLMTAEIARLNSWATEGREPDLTVLLDMDPELGLGRRARSADRLEAEPLDFHRRVRAGFLALARAKPDHYLILDATAPVGQITEQIKDKIREVLPDPVPRATEAATGSFPVVPDHVPDEFTDQR